MINESEVYKIRYKPLTDKFLTGKESWVHGYNVIPKLGGSGKTFTDKKIVNRMFSKIKENSRYGIDFECEIVTFDLSEKSVSKKEL